MLLAEFPLKGRQVQDPGHVGRSLEKELKGAEKTIEVGKELKPKPSRACHRYHVITTSIQQ